MLVPIDFSPCSVNALRVAIGIAAPDGDLTLLHVIDEEFVDAAVAAGMGTADDLRGRLREQAEGSFVNILEDIDHQGVNIEKMTVVGLPFLEILKIARDLDLPMIVMGVKGSSTPTAEVLFGSTAERVLRGSRVPVLCVPC
jgi:Universal stress protein UspA and related nucleotide-binding proteins